MEEKCYSSELEYVFLDSHTYGQTVPTVES